MTFELSIPKEILSAIGTRIRAQRLAQALSQQDLAKMAGLSLGALRKLERDGYSSLETLVRTVQALGLVAELDELFVLKQRSIAQMELAEKTSQRKRAPRRKSI